MHRLRRFATLLGIIALPAFVLFPVLNASADTQTVSPPEIQTFGNPGDVVTETLKVSNDGTNALKYQVGVADFKAAGDEGAIDLLDDPNAPSSTFSLARWVTVEPSQFSVQPGQDKNLNITIRIPANAEAGTKLASVQLKIAGATVTGGSGASVQSNLNSLILLRVSGDIKEKLDIESFRTDKGYYTNGPVALTLKSHNSGNAHVAPAGYISITNEFGKKVKEIPLREANVLPDSSRSVRMDWTETGMIGRYTATLVATYGQQRQSLAASTTFIVFPVWLAAVLLAVIVVLLLLLTQRKNVKKIINRLTSD